MNIRSKEARKASRIYRREYCLTVIARIVPDVALESIKSLLRKVDEDWDYDYSTHKYTWGKRASFVVYFNSTLEPDSPELKEITSTLIDTNNKKFGFMDEWEATLTVADETFVDEENSFNLNANRINIRRMRKMPNSGQPKGCAVDGGIG